LGSGYAETTIVTTFLRNPRQAHFQAPLARLRSWKGQPASRDILFNARAQCEAVARGTLQSFNTLELDLSGVDL
jgi:hypothetical protein